MSTNEYRLRRQTCPGIQPVPTSIFTPVFFLAVEQYALILSRCFFFRGVFLLYVSDLVRSCACVPFFFESDYSLHRLVCLPVISRKRLHKSDRPSFFFSRDRSVPEHAWPGSWYCRVGPVQICMIYWLYHLSFLQAWICTTIKQLLHNLSRDIGRRGARSSRPHIVTYL